MLTLPIKKKWFEMIVSGAKKEEYRDIKPYYTSRFRRLKTEEEMKIRLRNGYSRNSPSVVVVCRLKKARACLNGAQRRARSITFSKYFRPDPKLN